MKQTGKAVEELAAKLVDNYKFNRNIVGNGTNSFDIPNQKVVFILGAGASHAAAGLPLGKELAADLIHKLNCKTGEGKKQFDDLLLHMEQTYGFDKDDFKTILFSLNQINSETLVDFVQDALLNKFAKNISYEFVAKLLYEKHIDAVINFNFDEILDTNIQEQFSDNSKHINVFSDDTCPSELSSLINQYNRFHHPVYIKPHGTISQRKSLRFARKDFYQIEPLQKKLIEDLLSHTPVNLVIVGFRLKFFEFSKIIVKSLLPGSQIFIVDKNEDILDPHITQFYQGNFLKVTDENSLDDIMLSLSEALSNKMEKQSIHVS